jgi:HSP20 family protein
MALIRWEPAAELNTIQNEMNRLFNTFFQQPNQTSRGNDTPRRWLPPMDLVETADHYVLRADLPGLADGDVNVQLEDHVLTISGERITEHEQQQEGYHRLERAFGAFSRSLTLPDGVDPDRVEAHFDRGVLGGFNRSSQRLTEERWDVELQWLGVEGDGPAVVAFAGTPAGRVSDRSRGVLAGDRRRDDYDEGGGAGWCVGAGWQPVVSSGWRHANSVSGPFVGAISVVC